MKYFVKYNHKKCTARELAEAILSTNYFAYKILYAKKNDNYNLILLEIENLQVLRIGS